MTVMRRSLLLLLGGVVVLGLSLGAAAIYGKFTGTNPHWKEVAGPRPFSAEAQSRCENAIKTAEDAAMTAVALRAKQFHDFVAQRQYRTSEEGINAVKAFVDDMLSLGSKGRLIWSKMPFTDRDGYKKHVSRLFSKHLFSADELAAELKRDVDEALMDVGAIENQLAVELREIITDSAPSSGRGVVAPDQFKSTMERIAKAGQWDLTKDIGNLVASEIAATIGVQVLVRMGVSAGILSAGAASSPWTLGAGAVVGILADFAWGWIDNPEADIERDVFQATTKIGMDGMNALNVEFSKALQQRANLWRLSANELRP
jgi:hypothetical protein